MIAHKTWCRYLARACELLALALWFSSIYFWYLPNATNRPRPDLGRTHCLNNHGTLVCLTDHEWHIFVGLIIASGAMLVFAIILGYASGEKLNAKATAQNWWIRNSELDEKHGWKVRRY